MSSSPKSPKHTKKDLVGFDTESALVSLEKKNSYLLEVFSNIFYDSN